MEPKTLLLSSRESPLVEINRRFELRERVVRTTAPISLRHEKASRHPGNEIGIQLGTACKLAKSEHSGCAALSLSGSADGCRSVAICRGAARH